MKQEIIEHRAGLDADSKRVLARCRSFLGVDVLSDETAELAAKNIISALAVMNEEERRQFGMMLLSVLSDIQKVIVRLREERDDVGANIHVLAVHRDASSRYLKGES